jgi:hypothetical protein
MVLELGWHTPTHFISHDPRMRRDDRYGPYMISSGLPMRYFQHGVGRTELWHMPAQWDESQTIGRHDDLRRGPMASAPERVTGMVGLSAQEYGMELARFAQDAAQRWHAMQICNFHPVYVADPQDHPRASRRALESGLAGARAAGCRFDNQEAWSRFSRARADVRLREWRRTEDGVVMALESAEGITGLTLVVPDGVASAADAATGERFSLLTLRREARLQRMVTLDLPPGRPRRLVFRLKTNGSQ